MRDFLLKLWRLEGTVGRLAYAAGGLGAFIVKFGIDWTIARAFGQHWRLINYWHLAGAHITTGEFIALLTAALPFIWFGVAMSFLRSRDAGVPPFLVTLFFVPVLNLLYFAALCVLPPRAVRADIPRSDKTESAKTIESAIYAVLLATVIALPCIALSTFLFQQYGLMLFVGLPFCIGFVAAVVHGWRYPRSQAESLLVALASLTFVGGALLAVAWEGFVCLAMAAPPALALAVIGALFGGLVQRSRTTPRSAAFCVPALLPLMLFTFPVRDEPARQVASSIEINAPAEEVWKNVIGFDDISEPPELLFRAGIAYPLRARISGRGPGAIRYCIFSTGAFVEPIEVWDAPRRLAFRVAANPAPMRELSPYDIRPPHIDGYFASSRGEFRLESLPNGRTRLTGSTWYRNGLAPAAYWQLWSDAIIHRIHLRVLRHIRNLSERSSRPRAASDSRSGVSESR